MEHFIHKNRHNIYNCKLCIKYHKKIYRILTKEDNIIRSKYRYLENDQYQNNRVYNFKYIIFFK